MHTPPPSRQRHYGLDWLRIGAFALLILYHVAMVFAPWAWVIHTPHTYAALIAPMALLTPWRLALLFAVSGYASRKLFDRAPDPAGFARARAMRLLVPLAFGMVALVPIEMWVRVRENGYPDDYLRFWAIDYWRVGSFWGRSFPSWEHLWFVAYLASYTLILAAMLRWSAAGLARVTARASDWLTPGNRLLWAPIAALATMRLALLFVVPEGQGLLSDWGGHSQYFPIFLAGFVLGGTPVLWPALARQWPAALLVAALSGAGAVAIELIWPGTAVPPHAVMALDRALRSAMAWSMILLLFVAAERWWNHDHRWRAPLAQAVFPFYLVHHPMIVLIAWYTLPLELQPWTEFGLILGGTLVMCWAAYALGRRIDWFGRLIGLPPRRDTRAGRDQGLRAAVRAAPAAPRPTDRR